MPKEMKTLAELGKTADEIGRVLEEGLSKEWDLLERPYPIAMHYCRNRLERDNIQSGALENMLGAYYALCLRERVGPYLELHADLLAQGHDRREKRFEFANDAYVYAIEERQVKPKPLPVIEGLDLNDENERFLARAIVLETQSRNYLIVLNKTYRYWHLHFREFSHPEHRGMPALSTCLEGSLMPGEDDAGVGFRYADARDRGYIVSLKDDEGRPDVADAFAASYYAMSNIMLNLSSAALVLEESSAES